MARRSLRAVLTAATLTIAGLTSLATTSLVVLTSLLHRTTLLAGTAAESIRIVEEAEVDLLLHGRAADPFVRSDLEGSLERKLRQAGAFVATEEEAALLETARRTVTAYVEVAADPTATEEAVGALQGTAYRALEALVTMNVLQAKEAERSATAWDALANWIGFGTGALLVVIVGGTMTWLHRGAFRPVFALADTMGRFGRGERDARAVEAGPTELVEMARRFNEMAEALASQREARIAFVGGVAHDLKTPLTALEMRLAMVHPERGQSPERVSASLAVARRQVQRIQRMIDDLADVTVIEAGRLELKRATTDLRALVHDAVDLFHDDPRRDDVVVAAGDPVEASCDPLRIGQVVTNLVSNALKYSSPGQRVEVLVEARPDAAVVAVTDHGIGIDLADQSQLFEPFRRVGARQGTVPGSGLGLFVVRRIVEAHGGHIAVRSGAGEGSTFEVVLPQGVSRAVALSHH